MEILEEILEEIKPGEEERKKLAETSEKLVERAEDEGSKLEVEIEPRLVGSAARGTWLSGERDIDLFLLFPKDISREKLEEKGLEVGKKISEGRGSEQYAEHPYINAEIEGFDVDIVPCYDIEDPSNLRSAVDRSPHHQDYIKGWLTPERADQVLLLKKFLKGVGAYGSELKVHGFSGYLSELLIARFGSFSKLVESAGEWGSSKIIAPKDERSREDLRTLFPGQPLIYVDPVDPGRNVAAAVSKENYATFVRACQAFAEEPREEFFFPSEPPSSKEELLELIESREAKTFMISFEIPFDLVPDIIYPQLRKTRRALEKRLEGSGFQVLRGGVWAEGRKACILLELEVSELPAVKEHVGPPLGVDAEPFIQKHLGSERKLAGPFINEDGHLVFELEREETRAKGVLQNAMESLEGFGSHVEKAIKEEGYKIRENSGIVKGADELGALKFLGDYLARSLPWYY